MAFPINTSGQIFSVSGIRQLFEFQTKEDRDAGRTRKPKLDRETGQPLYAVSIYLPGARMVVDVRVLGQPSGIVPESEVKIDGLTLNHWRMQRNGRDSEGVTYRADKVEPATVAVGKAS